MKAVSALIRRVALCAVLAPAVLAHAQTLLYTSPAGGERTDVDGVTIGCRFRVADSNMVVSALGVWDKDGDGLLAAHDVGLWTDDGSTLLGSVTVPAGTGGTLMGGAFRFVDLASAVTLTNGLFYRVGSLQAGSEPFREGAATFSSDVESDATRAYGIGAGLTFPASTAANAPWGYQGANLAFTLAEPPPPPPPPERGELFIARATAASSVDGANVQTKTTDGLELSGPKPLHVSGSFPTQNNTSHFWLASTYPAWIVWDLGADLPVGWVHVWNICISDYWNPLGVKTAEVYASSDSMTWQFVETLTFAQVSGSGPDPGELKKFSAKFSARYIKFQITEQHGNGSPDSRVGLSEAAFYRAIPAGTTVSVR